MLFGRREEPTGDGTKAEEYWVDMADRRAAVAAYSLMVAVVDSVE
jgi:hypothetical protein